MITLISLNSLNSLTSLTSLISLISCQKGLGLASIKKFGWMGHTKRISHSAK